MKDPHVVLGVPKDASDAQIRRVFGLARAAGLDRSGVLALLARVAGSADADALNREQVQDVYDALEILVTTGRAA